MAIMHFLKRKHRTVFNIVHNLLQIFDFVLIKGYVSEMCRIISHINKYTSLIVYLKYNIEVFNKNISDCYSYFINIV